LSTEIIPAASKENNKQSMCLTDIALAVRSKIHSFQYGLEDKIVDGVVFPSIFSGSSFLPVLDSKKRMS
jgi:hypothetical protein